MNKIQTTGNSEDFISSDEMKIVDKTLTEITDVLEKNLAEIHYTIGEIILKNIFDGDKKLALKINEKGSTGSKITLFKCLEDKFSSIFPGSGIRKKTWLYNAINLVLDKDLLSNVPEYEILSVSHKIELLPVKDLEIKKGLIIKIVSENQSVREARLSIAKTRTEPQRTGLLTYIKKPALIEDPDDIKLQGGKIKEKALREAANKIEDLENEIKDRNLYVHHLKRLKERLEKHEPKKGRPS